MNDHPSKQSDSGQNRDNQDESILLLTSPVKASFVNRYLMALSPIFLAIICIFTQRLLKNILGAASSQYAAAVPGYSSIITSFTNITILLIAPVGIFILFIVIGVRWRITELWAGTFLTLILSSATAIVLASVGVSPDRSGDYLVLFLQWISYLVQPFCVIAAVIVIFTTEKFRRSIRYTIKKDALWICGGFWGIQENMIPHHQIGGIVLEQGFLGKKYNFGTVIPQTISRLGTDGSFMGIASKDQKEALREPLDCLYGIPDPKKAQQILTELIHSEAVRGEEQVSPSIKKYDTDVSVMRPGRSGIQPAALPLDSGFDIQDDNREIRGKDTMPDENIPDNQESTIIRGADYDIPETTISPAGCYSREIPPFVKPKQDQKPKTPLVQAGPPAESTLDQIKKLAELRDAGIISEQEFATKKTELLKRI